MTLAQAVENWMVKYKQRSIKPATYDRLVTSLALMKKHRIADIPPSALTSDDIQSYLNDLVTDGYALTTIKKQFHLLTGYLRYANSVGEVERPIHNTAQLPTRSVVLKPEKEVVAYSPPEQMALRQVLRTAKHPAYSLALFMMETGTRVGEALALTWRDINWSRRSVRIDKTVVHLGNSKRSFIQNEAKSYTSNRTIPLSTGALELLTKMFEKATDRNGLIFQVDGHTITYESVRYHIQSACREANVPYHGQHVFRHTFATNCYNRGCDVKKLSKLLGHANVTVTYNIYIHLFGDEVEEMRSVVG